MVFIWKNLAKNNNCFQQTIHINTGVSRSPKNSGGVKNFLKNLENFLKNLENFLKDFENFQKNFENFQKNFEKIEGFNDFFKKISSIFVSF
jgi:hypothetical protein